MAYKIWKDHLKLKGSIVAPGDIAVETLGGTKKHIQAGQASATDDIIVTSGILLDAGAGGTSVDPGKVKAKIDMALYAGTTTSTDLHIKLYADAQDGGNFILYDQAGGAVAVQGGHNGDAPGDGGTLTFGKNGAVGTTLKAVDGTWAGKQFDIGGTLTVGGDFTLSNSTLRIDNGNSVIESAEFKIDDEITILGLGSGGEPAGAHKMGFRFGYDGAGQDANPGGLDLLWHNTNKEFTVYNNRNMTADFDGADLYDLQANKLYGSIDKLTGVGTPTKVKQFEISAKANATHTLTAADLGKTCLLTYTGGGNTTLTLPAISAVRPGQTIKIKAGVANGVGDSGKRCIINTASAADVIGSGTNGAGTLSIELDTKHAAVELLCLGAGVLVGYNGSNVSKNRWAIM